jgi:hypothetical protein
MQLIIQGSKTIGGIQKEFNDQFPFLKLVFFSRSHQAHEGSKAELILRDPARVLFDCGVFSGDGALEIRPDMSVWQLERQFENDFGLHVQVFRKSGSSWLETSQTDDMTLLQQNERGLQAETPAVPAEDPIDYRDQD